MCTFVISFIYFFTIVIHPCPAQLVKAKIRVFSARTGGFESLFSPGALEYGV